MMKLGPQLAAVSLLGIAAGMLPLEAAHAQEASAQASSEAQKPAEPKEKEGLALEEIVVTADRNNSYSADLVQAGSFRGARALDTPLTIAVIPKEVIDAQQATQLLDALRNTAGVSTSQVTTTVYSNVAIRGILVGTTSSYRLNGGLSIINQIDMPLEDKERVEALKGASALYYGLTSPAGIINLTMKRPTEDPLLTVKAFGNSHGAAGGHVDVGGTFGKFGARINAVYDKVDSGIDHTRGTRTVLAGAFDYRPTDTLTLSFDAEHIFKKLNEPGIYRYIKTPAATPENPYPAYALPSLIDPSINFGPDWATNRADETNLLATADWKISPAWALTVSAGTSKWSRDRHFNTLDPLNPQATPGEYLLTVNLQPNSRITNKSLRAELAGTFRTGPITHELLIGVSDNIRNIYNPSQVAVTFSQSILNPHPLPEVPFGVPTYTNTQADDIGYYLFDRIKFSEWLQVLGGVRKTDYTESGLKDGTNPTGKTFHTSPVSFSGGVVVKPVKWASVYATYIEGLEALQGAPVTAANAGFIPPPGESTQKEIGLKVEPHRGLMFQAAYFDIKREQAILNVANIYGKDGQARYEGFEASLTGEITRNLSIYASGMILSAKQISGTPTGIYCVNAACTTTRFVPTTVGKRVDNTPRYTASIAAEYRLDSFLPGVSVNAAMYYIGDRAVQPQNNVFVPGFTTYSLGASYKTVIADHDVDFRIYADNITGKRYWASTGQQLIAQNAPSTIKFSVTTSLF